MTTLPDTLAEVDSAPLKDPIQFVCSLLDDAVKGGNEMPFHEALRSHWIIRNVPIEILDACWQASREPRGLIRLASHFADRGVIVRTICACARTVLPLVPGPAGLPEAVIAAAEGNPYGEPTSPNLLEMAGELDQRLLLTEKPSALHAVRSVQRAALSAIIVGSRSWVGFGAGAAVEAIDAVVLEHDRSITATVEAEATENVLGIIRTRLSCPTLSEVIDYAHRHWTAAR